METTGTHDRRRSTRLAVLILSALCVLPVLWWWAFPGLFAGEDRRLVALMRRERHGNGAESREADLVWATERAYAVQAGAKLAAQGWVLEHVEFRHLPDERSRGTVQPPWPLPERWFWPKRLWVLVQVRPAAGGAGLGLRLEQHPQRDLALAEQERWGVQLDSPDKADLPSAEVLRPVAETLLTELFSLPQNPLTEAVRLEVAQLRQRIWGMWLAGCVLLGVAGVLALWRGLLGWRMLLAGWGVVYVAWLSWRAMQPGFAPPMGLLASNEPYPFAATPGQTLFWLLACLVSGVWAWPQLWRWLRGQDRVARWGVAGLLGVAVLLRQAQGPLGPVFRRTVLYEMMNALYDEYTFRLLMNSGKHYMYGFALDSLHFVASGGLLLSEEWLFRLHGLLGALSVVLLYLFMLRVAELPRLRLPWLPDSGEDLAGVSTAPGLRVAGLLAAGALALHPLAIRVHTSEAYSAAILCWLWAALWVRAVTLNERGRSALPGEVFLFCLVVYGTHLRYLTILMPLQVYGVGVLLLPRLSWRLVSRQMLLCAAALAASYSHILNVLTLPSLDQPQQSGGLQHLRLVLSCVEHPLHLPGIAALAVIGLMVCLAARDRRLLLLPMLWVTDLPLQIRTQLHADAFRYYLRAMPVHYLVAALGLVWLVSWYFARPHRRERDFGVWLLALLALTYSVPGGLDEGLLKMGRAVLLTVGTPWPGGELATLLHFLPTGDSVSRVLWLSAGSWLLGWALWLVYRKWQLPWPPVTLAVACAVVLGRQLWLDSPEVPKAVWLLAGVLALRGATALGWWVAGWLRDSGKGGAQTVLRLEAVLIGAVFLVHLTSMWQSYRAFNTPNVYDEEYQWLRRAFVVLPPTLEVVNSTYKVPFQRPLTWSYQPSPLPYPHWTTTSYQKTLLSSLWGRVLNPDYTVHADTHLTFPDWHGGAKPYLTKRLELDVLDYRGGQGDYDTPFTAGESVEIGFWAEMPKAEVTGEDGGTGE